eukprot:7089798-Prymnesium_polylepis.1
MCGFPSAAVDLSRTGAPRSSTPRRSPGRTTCRRPVKCHSGSISGTTRHRRSLDRGTAICRLRWCSTAHRLPPCPAPCRCRRMKSAKRTAR